jgi:anti-sigma factor RsiW
MTCDAWTAKLDAYLDGELPPADAAELNAHLRACAGCAAGALERTRLKRSLAAAGRRYSPSLRLRQQIEARAAAKNRGRGLWRWNMFSVPAVVVLIIVLAGGLYLARENARQNRVYSELADLHVNALASTTPVDVLSEDRHTVKPWFEGKIPFSFNLPELQGSDFTLLGGRVTYLAQTPGAHLIYRMRKHEISVFIFPDSSAASASLPEGASHTLSFNAESWEQNGLHYFVVGDISAADIHELSELFRKAG